MRNIIVCLVILLLSGCLATTPSHQPVASATQYSQLGAIVKSPNEHGWSIIQANQMGLAFAKSYDSNKATAIANTALFPVDEYENDSEFLKYIVTQREANDDKNRFKAISVNNEYVNYKNTSCIKYKTLSEDHANNGIDSDKFEYLKTYGYICRHPANKVFAFQMEISHRSSSKTFPNSLLAVGDEFFGQINLVNNKVK